MKPRVTINLRADGELELWINSEGRDLLVQELLGLGEERDHIHLTPKDWGPAEVKLSQRSYRTTDKVILSARYCFGRMNGTARIFRMFWGATSKRDVDLFGAPA